MIGYKRNRDKIINIIKTQAKLVEW